MSFKVIRSILVLITLLATTFAFDFTISGTKALHEEGEGSIYVHAQDNGVTLSKENLVFHIVKEQCVKSCQDLESGYDCFLNCCKYQQCRVQWQLPDRLTCDDNELSQNTLSCTFSLSTSNFYLVALEYENGIQEADEAFIVDVYPHIGLRHEGQEEITSGEKGSFSIVIEDYNLRGYNTVLDPKHVDTLFIPLIPIESADCSACGDDDFCRLLKCHECLEECEIDDNYDLSLYNCAQRCREDVTDGDVTCKKTSSKDKIDCEYTLNQVGNFLITSTYREIKEINHAMFLQVHPSIQSASLTITENVNIGEETTITVEEVLDVDNNEVSLNSPFTNISLFKIDNTECVDQCDNIYDCIKECTSCFKLNQCDRKKDSYGCAKEHCSYNFVNHVDDMHPLCDENNGNLECNLKITKSGSYIPVLEYRNKPIFGGDVKLINILITEYTASDFVIDFESPIIAGHKTSFIISTPRRDKYGNENQKLEVEKLTLEIKKCQDENCDETDDIDTVNPVCLLARYRNTIRCDFTIIIPGEYIIESTYDESILITSDKHLEILHNVLDERNTVPDEDVQLEKGECKEIEVIPRDRFNNIIPYESVELIIEIYNSNRFVKQIESQEEDSFVFNICSDDLNPENPYIMYVLNRENNTFRSEPKAIEVVYGPVNYALYYDSEGNLIDDEIVTVDLTVGDTYSISIVTMNQYDIPVPYSKCFSTENIIVYNGISISNCDHGSLSDISLYYNCKDEKYEFTFTSAKMSECIVKLSFIEEDISFSIHSTLGDIIKLEAIDARESYTVGEEISIDFIGKDINNNIIELENNIEYTCDKCSDVSVSNGRITFKVLEETDVELEVSYTNLLEPISTIVNFYVEYNDISIMKVEGIYFDSQICDTECDIMLGDDVEVEIGAYNNFDVAINFIDDEHYHIDFCLLCNDGECSSMPYNSDTNRFIFPTDKLSSNCRIRAQITKDPNTINEKSFSKLLLSRYDVIEGYLKSFKDISGSDSYNVVVGYEVTVTLVGLNRNGREIQIENNLNVYSCIKSDAKVECDENDDEITDVSISGSKLTFKFEATDVDNYLVTVLSDEETVDTHTTEITVSYGGIIRLEAVNNEVIAGSDKAFSFKLFNNFNIEIPASIAIDRLSSESPITPLEQDEDLISFKFTDMDSVRNEVVIFLYEDGDISVQLQYPVKVLMGDVSSVRIRLSSDSEEFIVGDTVKFEIENIYNDVGVDVIEYLDEDMDVEFIIRDRESNLFTISRINTFTFEFSSEVSGEFEFTNVLLNGELLELEEEFTLTFEPGNLVKLDYILMDEDENIINGNSIVAGDEIYTLYVIARNQNGKLFENHEMYNLDNGGLSNFKETRGFEGEIYINGEKYTTILTKCTFSSRTTGHYTIAFGDDDNGVIRGGLFTVRVVPDIIDSSYSYASGNGVVQVFENTVVSFTVTLKDQYGNQIPYSEDDMIITVKINGGSNIPITVDSKDGNALVTYTSPSFDEEEKYDVSVYVYTDDLGTSILVNKPYTVRIYEEDTVPTLPTEIGPRSSYVVESDHFINGTITVSGSLSFNDESTTNVSPSLFKGTKPLIKVEDGGEVHLGGQLLFIVSDINDLFDGGNSDDEAELESTANETTIVIVEGISTGDIEPVISNKFNSCYTIYSTHGRETAKGDYTITFSYEFKEECMPATKEESLKGYAISGIIFAVLLFIIVIAIVVLFILWKKPFMKKKEVSNKENATRSYELRKQDTHDNNPYHGDGDEESSSYESDVDEESEKEETSEESEQEEDSSEGSAQEDSSEGSGQEDSSEESGQEDSSEGSESSGDEESS